MNCPACGYTLTQQDLGSIRVDVCDGGCGGAWFDNFELRKVDDAGAERLKSVARDPNLRIDHRARRKCPRCQDQLMLRRFFSRQRRTEIDECPSCAGLWLDAGEFEAIQVELGEGTDAGALSSTLNQTVSMLRSRSGM